MDIRLDKTMTKIIYYNNKTKNVTMKSHHCLNI